MKTIKKIFANCAVFSVFFSVCAHADIIAKPIPDGFHYPASEKTINKWIAKSDTVSMREHAWNLFAGMTANSGQFYRGKELPIWETWYGIDDVFSAPTLLTHRRTPSRSFFQPLQFTHIKTGLTLLQVLGPVQTRLLSDNKFNIEEAEFIVSPHKGPDGKLYYYNSSSSLTALNHAWPAGTKPEDRVIATPPKRAIVLKPAFSLVKEKGLTPMPLWQGPEASTRPETPTQETWTTCVLIDPENKEKKLRLATQDELIHANPAQGLSCKKYFYGPLSLFYSFPVSLEEADQFNKVRGAGAAAQNDYAALVALHVTTREAQFWTWQTFYWQPGADTPNHFPGSKLNQPSNLKSPWNNYAMCSNYAQTTSPGGHKMNVCLNPYIETSPGIPNGMSSNCMSCHGAGRLFDSASSPQDTVVYPLDYKKPVKFFDDPIYFDTTITRTEFSWAIPFLSAQDRNKKQK